MYLKYTLCIYNLRKKTLIFLILTITFVDLDFEELVFAFSVIGCHSIHIFRFLFKTLNVDTF